MMKILHIFKKISDHRGIPTIPFYVPLYLEKFKKYKNLIITLRDNYLPDIQEIHQGNLDTEHIPIKFGSNCYINLKLIKRIISYKPNLIIIYQHFSWPSLSFLLILCKILKIKIIVQPDIGEWTLPRIHKSIIRTFVDFIRYVMIRNQITMIDKIVYKTEYQYEVLNKIKKIPEIKGKIIPNISKFKIGTSKKENYIFSMSRDWTYGENLSLILEVFKMVKNEEKKYKLIIAGRFREGEDDFKNKIFSLIDNLKLKNYVKFVGQVKDSYKFELLKKAKILFLPSPFESFGNVFIEAMASGTPIVAMKNSAVKYVVKDNITGFLKNSRQEQKEAILRLLRDKDLYNYMQKNCLKEGKEYSWKNSITKWDDLIKMTLGKSN